MALPNYEKNYNEKKIITGYGNVDSNYIASVENNQYIKMGKIVTYRFTMRVGSNFDDTTAFVSGLPKPLSHTRFTGSLATGSNQGMPLRIELRTDGSLHNAYSPQRPEENSFIEGYICYISED